MNRQPLTPDQIIAASRQRLSEARSPATVVFEELSAYGMLATLDDLQLIDHDHWRSLRAEFDVLAASRLAEVEAQGGEQ